MTRALIVDDLAENLYLLEVLLRGHGFEVVQATNGAEALAMARQHPPDIVITDLLMPVMDGFELCRSLKTDPTLRHIPLVVYTATYTQPHDEALARAAGADLFLVKPMDPSDFVARLRGALADHAAGRLPPPAPSPLSEEEYLREHRNALAIKLEKKIRDLERANSALAEREAFLATVFGAVADRILVVDAAGFVVLASHHFTTPTWFSGHAEEQTEQRSLPPQRAGDLLQCVKRRRGEKPCGSGEECAFCRLNRALAAALESGASFTQLEVVLDVDEQGEERRWFSANVAPFEVRGRTYCVLVLHDVTSQRRAHEERQRLQLQLLQTQKMEALGRLAAGIAHDFNNVLQALLSLTTVFRLRVREPELTRIGGEMEGLLKRAGGLTRQLLLFARQQPTQRQPTDLGALLREAEPMLRRLLPERIAVSLQLPPEPCPFLADPVQIHQAIMNLAVNARDAMPNSGTLQLLVRREGQEVVLEVRDTGVGMDEAAAARAFEPFFSTKEPGRGTGLGLTVVDNVMRDHGGRVEVASAPGKGTTFRLVFPAAEETGHSPLPAGERLVLPPGRGRRVLLVEDNDGVRLGLASLLADAGYQVCPAESAEEACQMELDEAPDLLLTDLVLPSMSGLQLADRLRQRWPGLRVLLMSGYALEEGLRGPAEGRLRFLQKPFQIRDLAIEFEALFATEGEP